MTVFLKRSMIFQKFIEVCCSHSVFIKLSSFKSLLNLPKRSSFKSLLLILLWIKPLYFSAWFVTVFGKCVRLLVHASNRLV